MTTERADFRFTVKEGDDGKPWIAFLSPVRARIHESDVSIDGFGVPDQEV